MCSRRQLKRFGFADVARGMRLKGAEPFMIILLLLLLLLLQYKIKISIKWSGNIMVPLIYIGYFL